VTRSLSSDAGFAARLVFFALAPWAVVLGSLLFSMAGVLASLGLTLAVFFAGRAAHRLAARSRVVALLLSRELQFEAYYREHPPKPLLYYVFYPLLFPYWLTVREARREFWLFKGYTLFTLLVLIASVVFDYAREYPPELGVGDCAKISGFRLAFETALVVVILMPMITSIVKYHLEGARRRLGALAVVAALGTVVSIGVIAARRDPVASYATRRRLRLRTERDPAGARAAMLAALAAADAELRQGGELDRDGKVVGPAWDAAKNALTVFYKRDEAEAFDVWRGRRPFTLVVYHEAHGGNDPIWLAYDARRVEIYDVGLLPPGALDAMKHASK
jgi:hypothetical protein